MYGIISKGPCMDCAERKPGCHDQCEKYQAFKEETVNKKKWLAEQNRFGLYHSNVRFNRSKRKWEPVPRGVGRRNR